MFAHTTHRNGLKQQERARRAAKKLGFATCSHNKAPSQPDPDGCELGEFWDLGEDCDLWFWREDAKCLQATK